MTYTLKIWNFAKDCFFLLPLIGGMRTAKAREMRESASELALTLIFSLLPLWLVLIVASISINLSLCTTFFRLVDEGFLLIYSATLIGPSLYWIHKEYGPAETNKKMPHQRMMVSLISLVCLICSVVYVLVAPIDDATSLIEFKVDQVRVLSFAFVFLSVSALFVVQTYKNILEHSPQERREKGENNSMAGFRSGG